MIVIYLYHVFNIIMPKRKREDSSEEYSSNSLWKEGYDQKIEKSHFLKDFSLMHDKFQLDIQIFSYEKYTRNDISKTSLEERADNIHKYIVASFKSTRRCGRFSSWSPVPDVPMYYFLFKFIEFIEKIEKDSIDQEVSFKLNKKVPGYSDVVIKRIFTDIKNKNLSNIESSDQDTQDVKCILRSIMNRNSKKLYEFYQNQIKNIEQKRLFKS